jgi:hypothetical protein
MGFHSMKSKDERSREDLPHPIWRGIGVIMIVLVPILSFVIADELIRYFGNKFPEFVLPLEMQEAVDIPIYGEVKDFFGVLAFTVIIAIAIFALFSIVNAFVYRTTREKNLRVFESQPEKYKKKRKLKKAKDRYKKTDELF